MQEIEGTVVFFKSFRREEPIDCRDWLDLQVVEITMHRIKLMVRAIDPAVKKRIESRAQKKT